MATGQVQPPRMAITSALLMVGKKRDALRPPWGNGLSHNVDPLVTGPSGPSGHPTWAWLGDRDSSAQRGRPLSAATFLTPVFKGPHLSNSKIAKGSPEVPRGLFMQMLDLKQPSTTHPPK